MIAPDRSTAPRAGGEIAPGVTTDAFGVICEAMRRHAQVWAYVEGRPIHFCPQALGWHGEDVYVQALVLRERPGNVEGGGWEWLLRWKWLRLADVQIPALRPGDWIGCPPDQRPSIDFLTRVYREAA